MLRALPLLSVVLFVLIGAVGLAQAEEVFELENGMVLRGTPARETADEVVIRLTGFPDDARITVATSRIVRRQPGTLGRPPAALRPTTSAYTDAPSPGDDSVPRLSGHAWRAPATHILPLEEPSVHREGFLERLHRVAHLAMPTDMTSRGVLAALFFVALLALIGSGARLLEVEGLSLADAALLAGALGFMVLADTLHADELLRADRALWLVPTQAAVWLALALGTLRCGLGKAVLLLAFLLFSLSVVTFAAGAVLVAF